MGLTNVSKPDADRGMVVVVVVVLDGIQATGEGLVLRISTDYCMRALLPGQINGVSRFLLADGRSATTP